MTLYTPWEPQPLLSAAFLSPSGKVYTETGAGSHLVRLIVQYYSEWQDGEFYEHCFDLQTQYADDSYGELTDYALGIVGLGWLADVLRTKRGVIYDSPIWRPLEVLWERNA